MAYSRMPTPEDIERDLRRVDVGNNYGVIFTCAGCKRLTAVQHSAVRPLQVSRALNSMGFAGEDDNLAVLQAICLGVIPRTPLPGQTADEHDLFLRSLGRLYECFQALDPDFYDTGEMHPEVPAFFQLADARYRSALLRVEGL